MYTSQCLRMAVLLVILIQLVYLCSCYQAFKSCIGLYTLIAMDSSCFNSNTTNLLSLVTVIRTGEKQTLSAVSIICTVTALVFPIHTPLPALVSIIQTFMILAGLDSQGCTA